jgi:hypothetical protein
MVLTDIEIHTDQPNIKDVYFNDDLHLCDLFLKKLNGLKTPGTRKIVIILQKPGTDVFVKKERDKAFVLLDIIEFYKDFDSAKYEQAEIYEKKEILWTIIYESVLTSARQLHWDVNAIQNAYKQGLDLKLENKWVHTDKLASKGNQFFATLSVHFDFYSFKVFIDIKDANDITIVNKKIIDRDPSWGWYSFNHFKFSRWTSAREFSFGLNKDDPNKIVVEV